MTIKEGNSLGTETEGVMMLGENKERSESNVPHIYHVPTRGLAAIGRIPRQTSDQVHCMSKPPQEVVCAPVGDQGKKESPASRSNLRKDMDPSPTGSEGGRSAMGMSRRKCEREAGSTPENFRAGMLDQRLAQQEVAGDIEFTDEESDLLRDQRDHDVPEEGDAYAQDLRWNYSRFVEELKTMRDSEEIIELLGVWQDHLEDCRRDESWSINVDDDLSDVPILKIFVQMGEGFVYAKSTECYICHEIIKNPSSLRKHIDRHEKPWEINCEDYTIDCVSRITGRLFGVEGISEGYDNQYIPDVWICPICAKNGAPFISQDMRSARNHWKGRHEEFDRLSQLWGEIIALIKLGDDYPTMKDVFPEVDAYACPKCLFRVFGCAQAVGLHVKNTHSWNNEMEGQVNGIFVRLRPLCHFDLDETSRDNLLRTMGVVKSRLKIEKNEARLAKSTERILRGDNEENRLYGNDDVNPQTGPRGEEVPENIARRREEEERRRRARVIEEERNNLPVLVNAGVRIPMNINRRNQEERRLPQPEPEPIPERAGREAGTEERSEETEELQYSQDESNDDEEEKPDELTEWFRVPEYYEDERIRTERRRLLADLRPYMERDEREQREGFIMPQATKSVRKKISPPLCRLFTDDLLPMVKRCKIAASKEDLEYEIMNAMISYINVKIRETIWKEVNPNLDRKNRRIRNTNKAQEVRDASLRKDMLTKIGGCLANLSTFTPEMRRDGGENEFHRELLKTMNLIDNLPDELKDQIYQSFGDKDNALSALEGLVTDEIHRDNFIQWLDGEVARSTQRIGHFTQRYKTRIQEDYDDDPSRTFRNKIDVHITPACSAEPEEVFQYFSQIQEDIPQYKGNEDPQWRLDQKINEGDARGLVDYAFNLEKYQDAIRSRSNRTACGADGIMATALKSNSRIAAMIIRRIVHTGLLLGRAPISWKRSKTVLLYKKGDPKNPGSFRPIALTSIMYRIAQCVLNWSFQAYNSERPFISNTQKGFKQDVNGASEHIYVINELIADAHRKFKSIYIVTLDFKGAFDNVSHAQLFDAMRQLGVNDLMVNYLEDYYRESTTRVLVQGKYTEEIKIKKGVKQGCPLSPTLFSLALDPLLIALERMNIEGYKVTTRRGKSLLFAAQAYADDVVLVSSTEAGMRRLLNKVEEYCAFSGMKIAPEKCRSLTSIMFERRRTSLGIPFTICGKEIPRIDILSSTSYLGTPVALNKCSKQAVTKDKIVDIKNKVTLLGDSCLKWSQTIDAIRKLIQPELDYVMLNSALGVDDLKDLDTKIRGVISRKSGSMFYFPEPWFYMAWKDSGAGLSKFEERYSTLQFQTLLGVMYSEDPKVRMLAEQSFLDEMCTREATYQENSPFFGAVPEVCENDKITISGRKSGTSSLTAQAIMSMMKLHIGIRLKTLPNLDQVEAEDEERNPEHGKYTKVIVIDLLDNNAETEVTIQEVPRTIGKILKHRHAVLLENEYPYVGSQMFSLRNSPEANFYLSPRPNQVRDETTKFCYKMRLNILPFEHTVQVLKGTKNSPPGLYCSLCGKEETPIHRFNICYKRMNQYTNRHNAITFAVVEAAARNKKNNINSVSYDTTVDVQRIRKHQTGDSGNYVELGDFLLRRPDAWWYDPQKGKITMIEVTVPWAQMTTHRPEDVQEEENGDHPLNERMSSLEVARMTKLKKYRDYVSAIKNYCKVEVDLIVVVVSSAGAIEKNTIRDLKKIIQSKRELNRTLKTISLQAVIYSRQIWRLRKSDAIPVRGVDLHQAAREVIGNEDPPALEDPFREDVIPENFGEDAQEERSEEEEATIIPVPRMIEVDDQEEYDARWDLDANEALQNLLGEEVLTDYSDAYSDTQEDSQESQE